VKTKCFFINILILLYFPFLSYRYLSFYRFNRDRTMTWLKKKVAILSEKQEQERVYVGSGTRNLALADSKQLEVTQGQHFKKTYMYIHVLFRD